jgi:hypothetical protein
MAPASTSAMSRAASLIVSLGLTSRTCDVITSLTFMRILPHNAAAGDMPA